MLTQGNNSPNDGPVSASRRLLFVSRYWFLHAVVACLVVNALYLFHETGMPIAKHDFVGMSFRSLTKPEETDWAAIKYGKSLVDMIPSPFPRSFLEGVDQQMADMDRPRGAYLLGVRIPGEIHWFHLVGYAMKEQLAVLLAAMAGLVCFGARLLPNKLLRLFQFGSVGFESLKGFAQSGTVEDNRSTLAADASGSDQSLDHSLRTFCAFFLVVFGLFMTSQSNLVWNVRYLIPALPMIYLLVAYSVPVFEVRFASKDGNKSQPAASAVGFDESKIVTSRPIDLVFVTILSVACVEFLFQFPHHFSYINPLFGGSYRVPIALNDSNFDYGQDLFYARDWGKQRRAKASGPTSSKVFGVLSGHGCSWLEGTVEPATVEILRKAIRAKHDGETSTGTAISSDTDSSVQPNDDVLIVSRGLFHPEPWAVRYSKLGDHPLDLDELPLVQELLAHPPDVWITPVVVVYRLSGK